MFKKQRRPMGEFGAEAGRCMLFFAISVSLRMEVGRFPLAQTKNRTIQNHCAANDSWR